jgi:two-component system OmpR family sensor kinase
VLPGWLARLPVRVRLTAWSVGLLTVLLAALGAFLLLRLRADLVAEVDDALDGQAAQLLATPGGLADGGGADVAGLPRGEAVAQRLAPDGRVVDRAGQPPPVAPLLDRAALQRVLAGREVRAEVRAGPEREPYRLLAVRAQTGGAPAALVVAISLDDVEHSVERVRLLLLIAGPIALALAAGGGWLLAGAALRPVDRLTEQAGAIGAERLADRVSVPRAADELARLARTLNGMLDRIERGVAEQRRFVADASHELRTPLAVMRAELEVALRGTDLDAAAAEVLASCDEEVARMGKIVEDLLTLAHRDENRLELLLGPVDLAEVAAEVVATLRPLAVAGGLRLSVRGGAAPPVLADRARIAQVITNLVDNAVKYTGAGGSVRVRVWGEEGAAGLSVGDSGPGIGPEDLPRVFDRFFRLDAARSRRQGGSGLGLAICKELVEAHGGRIWAESRPGDGSTFALVLPAAQARADGEAAGSERAPDPALGVATAPKRRWRPW